MVGTLTYHQTERVDVVACHQNTADYTHHHRPPTSCTCEPMPPLVYIALWAMNNTKYQTLANYWGVL